MNAEQRTARYKNGHEIYCNGKTQAFQHRGPCLKKGLFGNKKPGSLEIGTQLGKDPTRLAIAKGKDPTAWKPWMGGNWSIFRMLNT